MGRGLSELQKNILRVAYRHHEEGNVARYTIFLSVGLSSQALEGMMDESAELVRDLPVSADLQEYIASHISHEKLEEVIPDFIELAQQHIHDTCTALGLDPAPVLEKAIFFKFGGRYIVNLFEMSTEQEADDLRMQMRLDGIAAYKSSFKFASDDAAQLGAYQHELLAECFGFAEFYVDSPIRADGSRRWYARFDRQAITEERYNRARASLSRALQRLEERGLIVKGAFSFESGYARSEGFNLTPDGLEIAKGLTVNIRYVHHGY